MTGRARRAPGAALTRDVFERLRQTLLAGGDGDLPFGAAEPAPAAPHPAAAAAPAGGKPAPAPAPPALHVEGEHMVLVTPEGLKYVVPLDELFARLGPAPQVARFVWPRGTRAVRAGPSGFVIAYEVPPGVRRLRWGVRASPEGRRFAYREVQLALPYLLLVTTVRTEEGGAMVFDGWAEAYFANEPLRSLREPLCPAPLLNVVGRSEPHHSGGAVVCMGGFSHTSPPGDSDPSERLQRGLAAVLGHFLESGFNEDFERTGRLSAFHDPHSKPADPRLATVEAWEEASVKDPSFVLGIPWVASGRSLSRALEALAQQLGIAPSASWSSTLQRLIVRHGARVGAAAGARSTETRPLPFLDP